MVDNLSIRRRSENMRRIKSRDTAPEIAVRRAVHGLGYRYRLQGNGLPGRPDLVLKRHRAVILVHGCFFHQHRHCIDGRRIPKSRPGYWIPKLARNKQRDRVNRAKLTRLGWRSLVIWECETKDFAVIQQRVSRFLSSAA